MKSVERYIVGIKTLRFYKVLEIENVFADVCIVKTKQFNIVRLVRDFFLLTEMTFNVQFVK